MPFFVETIGFGIFSGSLVSLGALGFTVQFGISNVLNVAYGAFFTLAAYIAYGLNQSGLALWPAAILTALLIGAGSAGFNWVLPRPLRRRGAGFVAVLIATVWGGIIITYLIVAIAGPSAFSYNAASGSTLHFAYFVLTTTQVTVVAVVVALMLAYHVLLTRTQLGKAMRATSVNLVVARSCGINCDRVTDVAWVLSGTLCGLTGVLLGVTTSTFDTGLGTTFLIYMIAAAVIGGIGQPYGAMLGGLIVGIVTQLIGAYWSPAYEDVGALVILILVLLLRPRGMFGAAATATRRLAA